jgi:hypothetical protein
MLIAIDPGTWDSGVVQLDSAGQIVAAAQMDNEHVLRLIAEAAPGTELVIEMLHFQSKAVGFDVMESLVWIGRFMERAAHLSVYRIRRDDLRYFWDASADADGTIREAMISELGGKELAIGTKKRPGPLFGASKHCYQALALALAHRRGCRSKIFTRADRAG